LKTKVEEFFDYKWNFDKNQALDDPEEKEILAQLPNEVQDRLMTNFIFRDFLGIFRAFFRIENMEASVKKEKEKAEKDKAIVEIGEM
jgi:hypothetical protein